MNFYIADLHLGHGNVLKYDGRPFGSVGEMNRTLINNWNNKVKKEDTVYILGDFCWGKEDEWVENLSKLNGIKVLIKGNHDLKQPSSKVKRHFADIKDYKEITDCQRRVIMCHYAIPFYKGAYSPNTYMLFGHVHNTRENDYLDELKKTLKKTMDDRPGNARGNFINVGCMMPWMGYKPRTLTEIIERSESYEEELAE